MEPVKRLAILGLATLGVYAAAITARYPLLAGLQTPRGTWTTLVGTSATALALHAAAYGLLTVLYLLALAAIREAAPRRAVPTVIGIWLACSVVLLGAYPGGESHDIFDYAFRGRMLAEFGASPLAITPSAFSRAPYYLYISWHSHVDTYGPLWEYASAGVAAGVRALLQRADRWPDMRQTCPASAESCSALVAYLTGYRLLAVVLVGLTGGLIYAMVRRVRAHDAPAALLAWLWNPVLLIGTAVGAHNDALLLALVMLALSLLQTRRLLAGLLVFALAAHVKLTALLLAPVLGVWLLRREGLPRTARLVVITAALAIPISWLLYAPLGGWETLPRMLHERGLFLASSPANVVYRWLYDTQGWGAPEARTVVQRAATLLFAAVALLVLGNLARGPADDDALWRGAASVSLAYVLIGSFWFQHWYLLWLLGPAALLPRSRLVWLVLPWYGLGALVANVAAAFLMAPSRLVLATAEATIIVGPLVTALAYVAIAQFQGKLRRRSAERTPI